MSEPGVYRPGCRQWPYRFRCGKCDREFSATRCTATYCSAKCRKYAQRAREQMEAARLAALTTESPTRRR